MKQLENHISESHRNGATGHRPRAQSSMALGPCPGGGRYPVLAAIDLGTSNCRLLVASLSPHIKQIKWQYNEKLRVIDAFSRPVHLGEKVNQTGVLSAPAMQRTLASLHAMARKLKYHRVTHVRAVATQACRQASNGNAFIQRIKQETGIDIDVINTREEAHLAVNGLSGLYCPHKSHAIVFDIGGGSTQIMWTKLSNGIPKIIDSISIPLGVVSLADTVGKRNLTDNEFHISVNFLRQQFKDFHHRNTIGDALQRNAIQVIGTSGTITTICAIYKNLQRYNRSLVDGEILPISDVLVICNTLRKMDLQERINHPCLGIERGPLMVAGCIILSAICQQWQAETIRIADRSVREGILYDLYNKSHSHESL